MAKRRKVAGASKKSKRRTGVRRSKTSGRRTGAKTTSKAKAKRSSTRKARPRKKAGIADTVARAAQVLADTIEETSELRRRMGHRGGLSEG